MKNNNPKGINVAKLDVLGNQISADPALKVKAAILTQRKLLMEEKSEEVIKKLLSIALNDEHPQQMTAIKVVVDRMLPMSEFEKEVKGGIKTVFVDRSCQGKVIVTSGETSIEMTNQEFLTVESE